MPGSVATGGSWSPMTERRLALIIANHQYKDTNLRHLVAPAHDAEALARVLQDPAIGGFEVQTLLNEPSYIVNRQIEVFFADGGRDDLLLLYFSCHGIKDEYGQLYFAAVDTSLRLLRSTGISANFVNDLMRRSRSHLQVLLLDCCYGGAFAKGMVVKADQSVGTREYFQGSGRVVLTASDAMQYAFEGDAVKGEGMRSFFTTALVNGLETGEADVDGDGFITIDELYDYVHDCVIEEMPGQSPEMWAFDVRGKIIIAQNPRPAVAARMRLMGFPSYQGSMAVTIDQVMSRGVNVLSPDSTVAEAAEQMRFTGLTEYPIIEEGRVVGLLTRRAVDRALQFKMSQTSVTQVMEAGSITISPDNSVEELVEVMIRSGWELVPVEKDGRIIGAVNRADLITSLAVLPSRPRRAPIQPLLEGALLPPILALVRQVAATAEKMGFTLYFVGQPARDVLLGGRVADVNFVTEGDAILLARRLAADLGGRVISHRRFGTAKWLLSPCVWQQVIDSIPEYDLPSSIDFTTARIEFYTHPTALPRVARSSIKHDLQRRDFTINALAIRLDPDHWGELLDFYGGEADLHDGVIRVLHSLSFADDPTRMIRAARLESRTGFRLDSRSEELIANALPLLARVSGDRIRHELEQIFAEPEPERVLFRLKELGILAHIHPSLRCDSWLQSKYRTVHAELEPQAWNLKPGDILFIYLALLAYRLGDKELDELTRRLHMRRKDIDHLRQLSCLKATLPQVDRVRRPSAIHRLLKPYVGRVLAVAWIATDSKRLPERLLRYQTKWRLVRTELTGQDLKAMGLKPGPLFGRLLGALHDARLDGRVNTREGEMAILEKLLAAEDAVEQTRSIRLEQDTGES
jgi:tRNA nucleotidyltransferase/poly(A) polymerase/predicted transcriptional regulator